MEIWTLLSITIYQTMTIAHLFLTAHPNISAASSSDNSGRTYIQDITVDSNGHVTGWTAIGETVTDTNTQLSTEEVQDIAGPLVATVREKKLL